MNCFIFFLFNERLLYVFVIGFVLIVDVYFRKIVLIFIFIDIDFMDNYDYYLYQVVEGFIKINKYQKIGLI